MENQEQVLIGVGESEQTSRKNEDGLNIDVLGEDSSFFQDGFPVT